MNDSNKPWLRIYDNYGDPSGRIVRNKQGLLILKESIEEALGSEKYIFLIS